MSDGIVRDLLLNSPVERRRTGDAVVLLYLAAKAEVGPAKAGSDDTGRGRDALWARLLPVTGTNARQNRIAIGAFGDAGASTVQLVGKCLLRLRAAPGAGTYDEPLIVAVDEDGNDLPADAKASRDGYHGYRLLRVYRPRAYGGPGKRLRAPDDVQPFPAFDAPPNLPEDSDEWLTRVCYPATNAAFTAAGIASGTAERTKHFRLWLEAMQRVVTVGERVHWNAACRALTEILFEEGVDADDMAERIAKIRLAAGRRRSEPPAGSRNASSQAVRRLTRSVDNWRRNADEPDLDSFSPQASEPPF